MKRVSWMIAVTAVLALGSFGNAQVVYQHDDGSSDAALGHGFFGDFFWGNYFDELPDGETISSISVAFGDGMVVAGQAFDVAIYEDTDDDGDPTTGLMFLTSVSGTVDLPEPVGTDTFQVIDIPDTTISGGFFIGAFMDGTPNAFPAKLDQTTSNLSSYFTENDTIGALDISDPFGTSTLSGLVDDFGFPGNWLLRAESPSKDCLIGDVNMDGDVTLLDVQPFVDLLTAGGNQCEADINEDGSVTLLDVQPFVDLLSGG